MSGSRIGSKPETTECELYRRWVECADADLQDELASYEHDPKALHDAFYRTLSFGTAGLRGIIGAGPNRMNVHTVAQATQGLADYLNSNFPCTQLSVAIARDSRSLGQQFCETAARVLAANGVRALLYPRIEPTPALSFAVRDLGCTAGINMTASHNPAEYNGYKVYGADGCQITSEAARSISEAIAATDMFDDVKMMDIGEAMHRDLICWIGDDTLDRFIDAVAAQRMGFDAGGLHLAYTPLHGTGLECVKRVLKRIGVTKLDVEADQAVPDGDFPTCPYPNPETRAALERGLELASLVRADLLVATDPDADRVGIAVVSDGEPVLLTGNEVGVLLTDFICRMNAERGSDLREKVAITTIVSSAMMDALAERYGFELRRTLTGFKYIGEQIGQLEAAGEEGRFIFGFEESYGYLSGTHVRDKDAVNASMLICEMAAYYRAREMNLAEAMEELYRTHGYYLNRTISLEYPGSEGARTMEAISTRLREQPPRSIAGLAVKHTVDYLQGAKMPLLGGRGDTEEQMLPNADVMELALEGGNKLIIRPSGTEPKIKAYLFARADTRKEAESLLHSLEIGARMLLSR